MLYYHQCGLLATDALRPFDPRRSGSVFGEGAGALVLETEELRRRRNAAVLGEVLGGGYAAEGAGLLAIREDGDGLAARSRQALAEADLAPADIGMIVAHGNGTPQSDSSEAAALRAVFGTGDAAPPVTAFKWAIGHLIAAAGIVETVIALAALRERHSSGHRHARLRSIPTARHLRVSASPQVPRGDMALILCRGFAGTNAALIIRALH